MISYLDLADENEISSQLGWSSRKHGCIQCLWIHMESSIIMAYTAYALCTQVYTIQ